MKKICCLALLSLVFLTAGICSGEVPDLLGRWAGSWSSYDEEKGFTNGIEQAGMTLAFTEQEGRIFAGNLTVKLGNRTLVEKGFAGAIGPDNKTLYIAEFDRGYATGTMVTNDDIDLIYLADGENASVAIDKLHRIEK